MKIAVIGASTGQLPLCETAHEMGLETICFAWPQGAICRDRVDKYYPVSITEKDRIVEICREEGIDGVVSNASDLTAEIVAYISEKLGLRGNSYQDVLRLRNKYFVRQATQKIEGLSPVPFQLYNPTKLFDKFPYVVKPISGSSKRGVSFVSNDKELLIAVQNASCQSDSIIIERFIDGREISVETLSYEGTHYLIQFTDKKTSGYPHFVELEHHQPAVLSESLKTRISIVVNDLLTAVNYRFGAAHIELKIDNSENLYLIEINPRGGGDEISNKLVRLSTGYDYIKGIIQVAIGDFSHPSCITSLYHSGIYYLCGQTSYLKDMFFCSDTYPWEVERFLSTSDINDALGNYDRSGYMIYKSNQKLNLV